MGVDVGDYGHIQDIEELRRLVGVVFFVVVVCVCVLLNVCRSHVRLIRDGSW